MISFDWGSFADFIYNESRIAFESPWQIEIELKLQNKVVKATEILEKHIKENQPKRIVLSGRPGSGKSFLLDCLAASLAEDLQNEINNLQPGIDSYLPETKTIVPIPIRLRHFLQQAISENKNFNVEILLSEQLQKYGLNGTLSLFFQSGPRFVLLIDDLDEIMHGDYQHNLRNVKQFIDKFPMIQTIVAGRRVATSIFDPSRVTTYQLLDLSQESMKALLGQVIGEQGGLLLNEIGQELDLLKFLSTPFFALAACEYWNTLTEATNKFRLGRLLQKALDDLVYAQQRIEYLEGIDLVLQQRLSSLKRLALGSMLSETSMLDHQLEAFREHLEWFQHMEFISHRKTTREFSNRWLHAYFAALSILEDIPTYEQQRTFLIEHLEPLSAVKTACIQSLEDLTGRNFVNLVTTTKELEAQFTKLEETLISSMFEKLVAEYINRELGHETHTSYNARYLENDEIDILAAKKRDEYHQEVWVVECKYRRPPADHKQITKAYLEQLYRKYNKVKHESEEDAKRKSQTVTVKALLFTNVGSLPSELSEFVKVNKIEVWEVNFPLEAFISRTRITKNRVRLIK